MSAVPSGHRPALTTVTGLSGRGERRSGGGARQAPRGEGAVANGSPSARADAAVRAGDLLGAASLLEPLLAATPVPEPSVTLPAAVAMLSRQGMLDRAAKICRWHEAQLEGVAAGAAAQTWLMLGERGQAEALLARPSTSAPTLAGAAAELVCDGLVESLDADPAPALPALVRAAESAALAGDPLLPEAPFAVAALAALHGGECDLAVGILQRELDRSTPSRQSAELLLAWALAMKGDVSGASAARDRAALHPWPDTRSAFWDAALGVALARRSEDPQLLQLAWDEARPWLLRFPLDLCTLLPLCELQLVSVRLHAEDAVASALASAWSLLEELGQPILWTAPLHWAGVQAAILGNRPQAIAPHARALVEASARWPFAATLAAAGRVWVRVLAGDVETDTVLATASALQRAGQAFEGRRLLGHAAAHCPDKRETALLLDAARRASALPSSEASDKGHIASLSEREVEVAKLVLRGRTYREIGDALYLSSRTVEHHIARMRRRLGVDTRAELLDRLRAALED